MPGVATKYGNGSMDNGNASGQKQDKKEKKQKKKREVIGGNKPIKPKFRKPFAQVFQLKIVVKGSKPPIWRRIEVPDTFDFLDLHHAIQDAMHGWLDYHLHSYTFPNDVVIDDPEEFDQQQECLPKVGTMLNTQFTKVGSSCIYLYDFGDDWEHKVTLEGISPKVEGMIYPRILAGKRACPIEDAGGLEGYMEKLEILGDPSNDEHEEIVDWVYRLTGTQRDGQEEFKPEYFNKEKVTFTLTTP